MNTVAAAGVLTGLTSAVVMARLRWRLAVAEHAAMTDPLTSLANRAGLHAEFERLIVAAEPDQPISVALLDLDEFKAINDEHGHAAGDRVLVKLAHRFSHCGLFAARLGGDEFVILFRGDERLDDVADALAAPIRLGAGTMLPRASIGLVTGQAEHARLADLLAEADAAMYRAKRAGADVCVYAAELDGPAVRAARPPVHTRDQHGVRLRSSR